MVKRKPSKVSPEVANNVSSGSEDEDALSESETRQLVVEERKKKSKGGGFQSFGLSRPIFRAILKQGYKLPTPIQRKTIPVIMSGKDVVAMARTGSGKTAAFILPLLERLKVHSAQTGARGLILSPTRELALQTYKFTKEFARFTDLKISIILGGDSIESQFESMHSNPDIIIGTPGRLLHILVEMKLKLTQVEYVVYDEADRLFEMGFAEQLTEILNRLPESRQTLLFSATLPKSLIEFAKAGLSDPELIRLDVENKISELLKMHFISCREEEKEAILLYLLKNTTVDGLTVVFAPTKHHVEYLNALMVKSGILSTYIYSSLDPEARKINTSLFRSKQVQVMIVTDIAARGIDIPLLNYVINYNFPPQGKLFVHRVGRVARAGKTGTAISLVGPDERAYLVELHQFISRDIKFVSPLTCADDDSLIGSVPQSIIDEEVECIHTWETSDFEVSSLKKVSNNALKQFCKTRPVASTDAVRRSKMLPFKQIPVHPIFKGPPVDKVMCKQTTSESLEDEKNKFLISLSSWKPNCTIFQLNSKKKSVPSNIVSTKAIDKKKGTLTKCTESASALVTIEEKKFHDEKFFLPYKPDGHDTEKGLSIGHRNDLDNAVFDVNGDEETDIRKSKSLVKWDRKKKKFVGDKETPKSKKIKTESGAYISSSYSSDLYKKWREKKNIAFVDDQSHNEQQLAGRRGKRAGGKVKQSKQSLRSELKLPEQILKTRGKAEKRKEFLEKRKSEKVNKKKRNT